MFSYLKLESISDIFVLVTIVNDVNMVSLEWFNNDGIIIIHRHKKEKDEFPEKFNIIEEKTYGISRVIFGNFF